ncbi:MAG: N-acetyltransferase [Bacteroidetes bacterium QH_7_62_13]|nr:MAG: N-acetyltransferase [Bacteroidetes bacterium QH_7_62_13]
MSLPSSTRQVTPLEEGRVRFSPLQMENIHTHFRWNNDPELNRLDSEVPYEEESFGDFKERFEQLCNEPSPDHRDFEIHDAEEDELIGVAYVARISPHHHHATIGLTIGERDYWGNGYGRESLRLLLRYCFENLDLHRVSAEAFEYNSAWRHLIRDAGFSREGTAREYLHRNGQYWDKGFFALLEQEYREQVGHDASAPSAEAAI